MAYFYASTDAIICAHHFFITMRTTLALDDDLLATAERYTGLKEKSALVREALRALIERESARRLAALGGSEPDLNPVARRKTPA
jgi:Arc/MetJ family transcription regulator